MSTTSVRLSLCGLMLLGMGMLGCQDPRIDVYEFLAMQEKTQEPMGRAPILLDVNVSVQKVSANRAAAQVWTDGTDGADTEVTAAASQLSDPNSPYRFGPGDVVTVSLIGLTGLETLAEPTIVTARINRDGEISLPLIGVIKIGGLENEDAEAEIRKAYVPKYVNTLSVNLDVKDFYTTDVVAVGACVLPGIVKLKHNERDVLHAVSAAGGMSQEASGRITLQRATNPNEKIDLYLWNSYDLKTVMALDPLETGDVVSVEAAEPNTIFVFGLVPGPGPKSFPPGTKVTALQALASAGGVIESLFPTEATLIRRMPNGEDVHVKLDLEKMKRQEDPNIMLAAGDILWVPETTGTRFMDFVNRNVFLRAGATVTYNATGVEFLNRRNIQGGRVGGRTTQDRVDPIGFLQPVP